MTGKKLERRRFLQICGATAMGSTFLTPSVQLLANDTSKRKNTRFKLSKPKWIIYENGSYDLISKEIVLKNCRPAINGQGVMPENVFLGDSPKGKRIIYELPGGFLMLNLKTNKDSISIGAELSGFSKAPRWLFPISQAEVFGVDRFFKQGPGTGEPSGIYNIMRPEVQKGKHPNPVTNWSHDSYLAFALFGKEETIAIGNVDHTNFLQRSTIYNRSHSNGLDDRNPNDEQIFFESGMLLEEIQIENEYIKLPDLHFYTGNKPFETLQELARKSSEVTHARHGIPTGYHWCTGENSSRTCSLDHLKKQIFFLNEAKPPLPLHSLLIGKGYCTVGDWLEPNAEWPGGLERAAREIFKNGYRAGIWIAPFAVAGNSKLFRQHPDWLIKDFNNKPIVQETKGTKTFYALDGSHPGVKKYLTKVFRELRKVGFIYYKTDFLEWGLKDSFNIKRAVPGKNSVQVFREILQLIRNEIGLGSLWVANHVPYAPTIGFADIVQVSNSISKSWCENGVINMLRESYYTHYFNNIFWQNVSCDVQLVNNNSGLTSDERRSLALWVGILGGAVGTSDNMTRWSEEDLRFFRFLEPSKRQENAYFPFWPDTDEIKVAVRGYKQQHGWAILFFNDKDVLVNKKFNVARLIGVEEVFVFGWNPDPVLPFGKAAEIDVILEPHQSRLFYLTEENEAPPDNLTLGGRISESLQKIN